MPITSRSGSMSSKTRRSRSFMVSAPMITPPPESGQSRRRGGRRAWWTVRGRQVVVTTTSCRSARRAVVSCWEPTVEDCGTRRALFPSLRLAPGLQRGGHRPDDRLPPGGGAHETFPPAAPCCAGSVTGGNRGGARLRGRRSDDLGRPRFPGPDMVRSRRGPRDHHPLHDLLRPPRRDGEAHAGAAGGPEPGRVVVGLEGRARVRVRPPQGCEVPRREPSYLGGREVLL